MGTERPVRNSERSRRDSLGDSLAENRRLQREDRYHRLDTSIIRAATQHPIVCAHVHNYLEGEVGYLEMHNALVLSLVQENMRLCEEIIRLHQTTTGPFVVEGGELGCAVRRADGGG